MGPARRVYERTDAGREELRRWLRSGPQLGAERFAYVGQLCFMAELDDPDEAEAFLLELQRTLEQKLEVLEQIEAGEITEKGTTWESADDETFFVWSALRVGIATLNAKVEWCGETLERLRLRRSGSSCASSDQGPEGA